MVREYVSSLRHEVAGVLQANKKQRTHPYYLILHNTHYVRVIVVVVVVVVWRQVVNSVLE